MDNKSFFGRQKELQILNREVDKKQSRLIVIRGRRRIGKSRLIEEFVKISNLKAYNFSGILPVKGTTLKMQLEEFTRQIGDMKTSGLSKYRLSDNYLRFYLKWIAPNQIKIEQDDFLEPLFPEGKKFLLHRSLTGRSTSF